MPNLSDENGQANQALVDRLKARAYMHENMGASVPTTLQAQIATLETWIAHLKMCSELRSSNSNPQRPGTSTCCFSRFDSHQTCVQGKPTSTALMQASNATPPSPKSCGRSATTHANPFATTYSKPINAKYG